MADGKFLVGKPSGGVTTVTVTDGATNTNLVLPESGTVSGVTTAVTDNAIARYDGTTGKLQNSGVFIDDSNHIGIGTALVSTNATVNIGDTRLANVNQYGINNNLTINPETLTANRNYFGITSTVSGTFANTTSYVPSVYGSYSMGIMLSGSNGIANDGAVYGSYIQAQANNSADATNKYIQTVIGTRSSAYINIAGYNNVANMYGVYADVSSGGTLANGSGVTNAYGVYITNPISSEAVTNNYGLYQATAGIYNVLMGETHIGALPSDTSSPKVVLNESGVTAYSTTAHGDITPDYILVANSVNSNYVEVRKSGIKFNTGGSADTNTLDYYEEGTFTPAIEGITTAGVGTYGGNQFGRYTRIGDICNFTIFLSWTAHTGTGTGMIVSGLPFVSANLTGLYYTFPLYISNIAYTGTKLSSRLAPNTSIISLYQTTTNTPTTFLPLDTAGTITISGSYKCV